MSFDYDYLQMPSAMIVFKCDHNCFCFSLCVFGQMIFLCCFFLLKILLFPTLLVSCSFREQLGGRPAKLLRQRRTHFIPFFKEQRKAWISYYSIQDNSFFKKLQPQARTTLKGASNFRRMGKICPKWSCLSEAESSGCVESPLSLVAQSRSSADYGLNGELRLIHPPISIIQEAGSIFVSQQIKTQCKTFALSTSNVF